MLGAECGGRLPCPSSQLLGPEAAWATGGSWRMEDSLKTVLVLEPLCPCFCIGAGSMAVVKPADHVQKGLGPRGSVERLTHPYVVATICVCLGGGWESW